VPLVDIDTPVEIPKDDDRKSLLLWLLIVLTFLSAALLGFALFSPWDSLTSNAVGPSSISPSIPAWKGIPVANGQLKGVVVDLPMAETDFHTGKEETIVVRVKIDQAGNVSSVDSRLGNDELRRAAMVAARKATFSAAKLRGKETAGTISYTFTP
jgi:TonB family protein